jgi:hypothetical protein
MTSLDYDDFQDKVFESITRDYGRISLKQIQQPQNKTLVKDILQNCLRSRETVEYSAKQLIRVVTQKLV